MTVASGFRQELQSLITARHLLCMCRIINGSLLEKIVMTSPVPKTDGRCLHYSFAGCHVQPTSLASIITSLGDIHVAQYLASRPRPQFPQQSRMALDMSVKVDSRGSPLNPIITTPGPGSPKYGASQLILRSFDSRLFSLQFVVFGCCRRVCVFSRSVATSCVPTPSPRLLTPSR